MQISINENKDSISEVKQNKTAKQDYVVDSKGRKLKLKKLDILSESRLVRMLGQEAVTNQIYMNGYVLPAVMVSEIDGDPVFLPQSQPQMEALIQRLDNEGIQAVLEHLQTKNSEIEAQEEQIKN